MGKRACLAAVLAVTLGACSGGSKPPAAPAMTRVRTDREFLRDGHGRYVSFHGVNVSGSSKVPARIDARGIPSYVGKPFPLEDADRHFATLQAMGFSAIRLLVIWEGIEPEQRGRYDREYLAYIRRVVEIAGEHGLYVLVDMHQDMFSRHLSVKYNSHPKYGKPGSVESTVHTLLGPYDDSVQGDGAPRWVVEACLQEKNLSSPNWGTPRMLGGLDEEALLNLYNLFNKLSSGGPPATPGSIDWIVDFLLRKPAPFPPNESSDVLPFTNWGSAHALSLDNARCNACLLAGDTVFPGLVKDGKDVKTYLQDAYANAWIELARSVADLPNVIGYDVMNEPSGNYILLAAVGALLKTGPDGVKTALSQMLGPETGPMVHQLVSDLRLLPPDTEPETLRLWGLDKLDAAAALQLNVGFDERYLRPFYERIGKAILTVDPDAVIYFEGSMNISMLIGSVGGIGGQWDVQMTRPALPQVVYAPHYYADIYPMLGFLQPPRNLTATQVRYRDYQPAIEHSRAFANDWLGNAPVVFGEFGSYFNFGGIYNARQEEYVATSHVLNNYYEAFERMFQSRMLWCWSPENDYGLGDRWNHEDFSIVDPDLEPRSELAWSRPHARALAGKPIETHFYSDFHYFDPDKGTPNATREFLVRYASKETSAPSEIVVPKVQYPDGFHVWVSDGRCYWDASRSTLFHYPSADDPTAVHEVRLLPPQEGTEHTGWKYFVRGETVIERR